MIMYGDLERIGQEIIVTYFDVVSQDSSALGLVETNENLQTDVSSGTGTRYLPNKIRSVTNDNLLAL
jgi:hypothetical protein